MEIVVDSVTKRFQGIPVVQDLTFDLQDGEILGLLGSNGAGKTTTLRMLLDVLRPDSGSIKYDSKMINRSIRNVIGYLPEERGIYQKYKVVDVLMYFGRLKKMSKRKSHVEAVRLLDRYDMIEYMDEPVFHLSKGLQQKIQFLVTIIHDPEIVILDEPFWGLDPLNQELLRKQIISFRENGKLVLLSTHQLNEAERLCDKFIMMEGGKTVLKGTLSDIRSKFRESIITVEAEDNLGDLREIRGIQKLVLENKQARLYVSEGVSVTPIVKNIVDVVNVSKIEINKPSLNDIFLKTIQSLRKP